MAMLSWPEAIVHADADAFYVSCEILRNPALKGKPVVVVGKLGGIILSKSDDLKRKGIKTGMPIWEARKIVPEVIAIHADFQWYNEMSFRLIELLKTWSPEVEVYSVDEAFLDIKGFRKLYKKDYAGIAYAIKEDIQSRLGITVSMGVSVTKTLAKMAAELNKPDGVSVISWKQIPAFLPRFLIEDVPGFGNNIVPLLEKCGIRSCADFVAVEEMSVRKLLHRPGLDLWKELQGIKVFPIQKQFAPNKMMTRTSSFAPLTDDESFVWAHTVRQLERALQALVMESQVTKEIVLFLRDKNFRSYSWSFEFETPTKHFSVMLEGLRNLWNSYFPRHTIFRSSGVSLLRLSKDTGLQMNLFEMPEIMIRKNRLEEMKEIVRDRYGNFSLRSASSLQLKALGPRSKKRFRARAFNVDW